MLSKLLERISNYKQVKKETNTIILPEHLGELDYELVSLLFLAINTCIVNNGGCHPNATCSIDLSQPSFRSCTCQQDFSGDGVVCIG